LVNQNAPHASSDNEELRPLLPVYARLINQL
jgi:hypothetical protein